MDNIRGTHSLLEASRLYGELQRFLHISTDEIYGENLTKEGFCETELPNPTNPYAATKIAAEFLVQSYFHCFELPILIVRGNNVYGPRQYPEKIISKFILYLLNDEKCTIQGNGYTRRNFVYVTDFCSAIDLILRKGEINEVYNIGTENEYSVLDIAQKIIQSIHGIHVSSNQYLEYIPDRYYNDFTYRIDSTKLQSLGWTPRVSFDQGIQYTSEYYIQNKKLYSHIFLPKIDYVI
jgi:dTDP-glucose 4,6-dehydratase